MANDFLPVITRTISRKVMLNDVLIIDRNNRTIHVISEKGNFAYYEKMENVCKYLDERFCRCMKGCVINLDKVDMMTESKIFFSNGRKLILARDAFLVAKKAYNEYIRRKQLM